MISSAINIAQYAKTLATVFGNMFSDSAEKGATRIARNVSCFVPEASAAEAPAETSKSAETNYSEEAHQNCVVWTTTDRWDYCTTAKKMMDPKAYGTAPSTPFSGEGASSPAKPEGDYVMVAGVGYVKRESLKMGEEKENVFEFYSRLLTEFAESDSFTSTSERSWRR